MDTGVALSVMVGAGGGGAGCTGGVVGVPAATCFLQPAIAITTITNKKHPTRNEDRFLISFCSWCFDCYLTVEANERELAVQPEAPRVDLGLLVPVRARPVS